MYCSTVNRLTSSDSTKCSTPRGCPDEVMQFKGAYVTVRSAKAHSRDLEVGQVHANET